MIKEVKETAFRDALLGQFKGKWIMLREAIDKCSNEKFHDGIGEWTYSWTTYHIIETAEFYIRDTHEGMIWGSRAGFDWKEDSKEKIKTKKTEITKEFLLEYLKEIEESIIEFLKENSDENLLKKDEFHWFNNIYEKLVYLLRHNSFHLGELAKTLREWECKRIKWS
ncbi:MAG: DinB family protein [Candidatus Heimdallarchaeota archaeon]|nr:DinB family protein [Candidatus Heimdallarchaeota archaeon]MCK4878876.1 DinB family protein [Candidatus Heimdallarchaeota archaeon]